MRILHVNNPSNVAVEIRDAQRRAGHESVVVATYPNPARANYAEDWRIHPASVGRAAFWLALRRLCRWADVVHCHGVRGTHPRLARIATLGKIVAAHYHGTDLRRGVGMRIRWADASFVATPDIWPKAREAAVLRFPVTPPDFAKAHEEKDVVTVLHAHAGNRDERGVEVKGSADIAALLGDLPRVRHVQVTGLPHAEALRAFREADVVVDQMRLGTHGVFAVEAMLMGVPVLGAVRPFSVDGVRWYNPVEPATLGDLRERVEALAADAGERRRIGERQRAFALRWNDPDRIAAFVERAYEGRAPAGQPFADPEGLA